MLLRRNPIPHDLDRGDGSSSSRISSSDSFRSAALRFSSRWAALVVPGVGTIQSCLASGLAVGEGEAHRTVAEGGHFEATRSQFSHLHRCLLSENCVPSLTVSCEPPDSDRPRAPASSRASPPGRRLSFGRRRPRGSGTARPSWSSLFPCRFPKFKQFESARVHLRT